MTLTEARNHIGDGVVYHPKGSHGSLAAGEDGVITSVGTYWVFVRYTILGSGIATDPADLELLTPDGGAA